MNKIRWIWATVAIVFLYIIIRLFFVQPLLSDVQFSYAYYDRNGELMRITLSPDDYYRIFVPLDEIADSVIDATILYEDKYFRYHPGINPVALTRAVVAYMRGISHPAGASTITMQVARMKYNLDTRQIWGKLVQIAAAIYIDAFHSKNEIIQAYLNLAPYGGNIEGIGAASQIYFHRRAADLTTIESITLATIPQNPTRRGLNTPAGVKNMRYMRGELIQKWVARHPDNNTLESMADMEIGAFGIRDLPFAAPHFINSQNTRNNFRPHKTPQKSEIETTIDMSIQRAMENALRTQINRRHAIGVENAAAILVNYKTMDVLAYVGAVDYFDKKIFGQNDGVRARRSPGSTLKPLIYAMASDIGLIHSMTLMRDARVNFGVYAPENADNEFYGPVLARDALTHSRNIPAINLVRQIGVKQFHKLLGDSGVGGLHNPQHYGISIALGGAEVSMYELARIYAMMANLGMRRELRTRLLDNADANNTQLLSREAFFITLDMLGRGNIPKRNIPFARRQHAPVYHYWKTGTSSSYRDAWTAGIFGDYVLIVWVGNFDGRPNNSFSGAKTAAPIYFELATAIENATAPIKNNNFLSPDMNIAQIEMCDDVGGIAGKYCPHTVMAYFIPGKSPIDTSSVYRQIPIDRATGRRACNNNPDTTYMDVYEFWDAEYLDMFRRAGIVRRTPPPYVSGCDLNEIAAQRAAPIITSPIDDARIIITTPGTRSPVSFQAVTEDYTAQIFWFVDDILIGTTRSGGVITHDLEMGRHIIRAVDSGGAGTSINISVVK